MLPLPSTWHLLAGLALLAGCSAGPQRSGVLPQAHSENDQRRDRPLHEALDRGFGSLEVGVLLEEGELLVARDPSERRDERSLERLYLGPLWARSRRLGGVHGPDSGPFLVFIDLPGDGPRSCQILEDSLRPFRSSLTRYEDGRVVPGAFTVLVAGQDSKTLLAHQNERLVFLDGDVGDLGGSLSAALIPVVSEAWDELPPWDGTGPVPEALILRLNRHTARARLQGRRFRVVGAPAEERVWRALLEAGVDVIGTRDLKGLERFLRRR